MAVKDMLALPKGARYHREAVEESMKKHAEDNEDRH